MNYAGFEMYIRKPLGQSLRPVCAPPEPHSRSGSINCPLCLYSFQIMFEHHEPYVVLCRAQSTYGSVRPHRLHWPCVMREKQITPTVSVLVDNISLFIVQNEVSPTHLVCSPARSRRISVWLGPVAPTSPPLYSGLSVVVPPQHSSEVSAADPTHGPLEECTAPFNQ